MSLWIEIRCENFVSLDDECLTVLMDSFGVLTCDDRRNMLHGLRLLEKDARKYGWVKTRKGWLCSHCKTLSRPHTQRKAMSEIVERLRCRGCYICGGDCASANPPVAYCPMKEDQDVADHITSLEATIAEKDEALMKAVSGCMELEGQAVAYRDRIASQAGEIERLREIIDEVCQSSHLSGCEIVTTLIAAMEQSLHTESG